ncbi:MAG: pseudouridine synthase [Bacteroidota bacterium]
MSFSKKIKYFLVHTLAYTNKRAQELIDKGLVEIDGQIISTNCLLDAGAEVRVNGTLERERQNFIYLKFYKPAGFQSSLNEGVDHHLAEFFRDYQNLSIAGRLDKMSEGLLLLSNDGKWVENMCNPKFEKEKEYLVTLDRIPGTDFAAAFSRGVNIVDYVTKPCECVVIGGNQINVILKEGKNRQIRRMGKALGYQVTGLKRVRIDMVYLGTLPAGVSEQIFPF